MKLLIYVLLAKGTSIDTYLPKKQQRTFYFCYNDNEEFIVFTGTLLETCWFDGYVSIHAVYVLFQQWESTGIINYSSITTNSILCKIQQRYQK